MTTVTHVVAVMVANSSAVSGRYKLPVRSDAAAITISGNTKQSSATDMNRLMALGADNSAENRDSSSSLFSFPVMIFPNNAEWLPTRECDAFAQGIMHQAKIIQG